MDSFSVSLSEQMTDLTNLAIQHLSNDSSFRSYLIDLEDKRLHQERIDIFDKAIYLFTGEKKGKQNGTKKGNGSDVPRNVRTIERKISFG